MIKDEVREIRKEGWIKQECGCYHGLDASRASWALETGGDPGMATCDTCGGSGYVWISPKGRTAFYPGGPFSGALSKKENDKLRLKGTIREVTIC